MKVHHQLGQVVASEARKKVEHEKRVKVNASGEKFFQSEYFK